MSLIIPNFKDSHGQALVDLPEVVLAKMLQQAEEPVELAFLQQSYTLNRDLQTIGLQDVPYWNAFDDLQQVQERAGLPLTIYDFPLADGLEPLFNNSGNQVLMYKADELKLEVTVHNQIEVEQVIHFLADGSQQIDNYDDRGFLSTTLWLNSEKQIQKMQWFTPFHEVVAEMDAKLKITISSQFRNQFWESNYPNLNELVAEMYQRHFELPKVVIAAFRSGADQQNRFYLELPAIRKIALLDQDVSLAKVQNAVTTDQEVKWVFPSRILKKQFLDQENQQQPKLDTIAIEPYPTAFTLGMSNEFEAQMIYWQFQQQTNETIASSLQPIFPLIFQNEKLVLLLDGTWEQRALFTELAKQWVQTITNVDTNSNDYQRYIEVGKPEEFSTEAEWLDYLDEQIDAEEVDFNQDQMHQFYQVGNFLARIQVVDDKTDLNDVFAKARLFIDQGPQADLRKQILAISTGVPIISFAPTDLVIEEGNGFQNTVVENLPAQISYFLDNLHHWNQSLVDSVGLMEEYEADQLLQRWKGVMTDG
ncbi:accessory Sec system protein Asp1 [Fructilactobacillus frigidiflavus]|uniref:accessory Sec system protein Asp1 n=1 Tax=Fructilactobacillus frigidiflavus TaxID=3242688 RepID=UPI0037577CBA